MTPLPIFQSLKSSREQISLLLCPSHRPGGEAVPKALHVSPLMDMKATW